MEDTQLLEAQILYSVIFTPEWVDLIKDLKFNYFKKVAEAIFKLKEEGKFIDYSAVYSLAKETKEMVEMVISEDNLGLTIIPNKKIFEERVELLVEEIAKKEVKEAFVNELDLEVLKEKLEKIHKKGLSRWLTGDDLKSLAFEILKKKQQNSITYNLSILDKATGGLEKGQYIIVAGRPSVGKSSFLQFVGLENALKGKKVLFVSAEMSEEMIVKRILTTYKPETIPQTFNILIASTTDTIDNEISRKARDFDLVLIDYIQLLKPKKNLKDLYERITEVSGEIKKMATKYNIPFLCASQFSRKAENQQPTLADLKESGALEQDADVVISLWRLKSDDDILVDETTIKVRVDLLKNRNGWTFSNGDIKEYSVMFKKDEFRFFDIEEKNI